MKAWALLGGALLAACAPSPGLRPFTSDGCSLFPDRALVGKADWCSCCLAHDLAYWRGGTEAERLAADRAFEACVLTRTADKVLATMMFNGVRAGGGPQLDTSFRWGYGWAYGRGYKALAPDERATADALESEYRARKEPGACGHPPSAGADPP
jgi:hypothetical protein